MFDITWNTEITHIFSFLIFVILMRKKKTKPPFITSKVEINVVQLDTEQKNAEEINSRLLHL